MFFLLVGCLFKDIGHLDKARLSCGRSVVSLLEGEESGFLAYDENLGAAYYDLAEGAWVSVSQWTEVEASLMESLTYDEWQEALGLGYRMYKLVFGIKEEITTAIVGLPAPGECATIQGYSLRDKQIIGLSVE